MPEGGELIIRTEAVLMDDKFVHAHGFGKPGSYACISVTDMARGWTSKQ